MTKKVNKNSKSVIKTRFKNKFSQVYNIPLKKIKVLPKIFQGRTVPFAKSTVAKIVREGFDKSQEPIIIFTDKDYKNIVISGHSRYEAAKQLYAKNDKSLKTIPVKYFKGDLDEAIDYAVIESNRSGKSEGIESDIKAYIRATERGYNKDFLRSIFKSDSYIDTLRNLSKLNAHGEFIKQLSKTSSKSFPYLLRNAGWVGTLRKIYPELANAHEKEMWNFFYEKGGKGLNVKKQSFFDIVKKKVENPFFKSKTPLKLNYTKEFERISDTDPGIKVYNQIKSSIANRRAERDRKEQLMVYAEQQKKHKIAQKLQREITDLTHNIRMKFIDELKWRLRLQKEDSRLKKTGLF